MLKIVINNIKNVDNKKPRLHNKRGFLNNTCFVEEHSLRRKTAHSQAT